MFPIRVKKTGDEIFISTVRETQSSPLELHELNRDVQMALIQRAAKICLPCYIREDILASLSWELLRQVRPFLIEY